MPLALLEAPCGHVAFDDTRVIRDVNEGAAGLLGRPRGELIGRPLATILPPATRVFFDAHLLPLLALQGRVDEVYASLRGAGGDVPVLLNAARAAGDGSGRVDCVFLPMRRRDVLERELVGAALSAEEAMRVKDEALLEAERVRARLTLHERLASLGTLAAGVAHEINNPLAYVAGNLELLDEALRRPGRDEAEFATLVREAREGAERIRGIVNTLRTLSRVEGARHTPVDLRRAVEVALRLAGGELRHRALVEVETGPVPLIEGDEGHLIQVVINLLVNAAQAFPPGPAERNVIRVVTRTDADGCAALEVHDNGPGVPAELHGQIFDPFFTTKPVGQGTGLGLSVCHGIVTSLGGRLWLESAPGAGACFHVALPPAPPSVRPSASPRTSAPDVPAGPAPKARALVIDDDALVASVLVRALGDYDVTVELDGRAAVARLEAGETFDVVICDLMMPGITGIDVHAAVARLAPALARQMIFMTGGAFTENVRAFLESVPNRRLAKPFGMRELRLACSAALAEARKATTP